MNEEYEIQWNEKYGEIYYSKISTYEKYVKFREKWSQLYEMSENDFRNYFLVIISLKKPNQYRIDISNVTTDENTTYIEISESENQMDYNNNNTFFSIKISKEYDRENLEINKVAITPYLEKYTSIAQLPENYSINQAIEDECFVLKDNKIVSSNQNQLDGFIEETEQGKENFIRIVLDLNEIEVIDIQYKNEKYIIARRFLEAENNFKINYMIYDKIISTRIGSIISIEAICNNKSKNDTLCIIQQ